jgi:NitT/TauT family transport system substrate-binding protein
VKRRKLLGVFGAAASTLATARAQGAPVRVRIGTTLADDIQSVLFAQRSGAYRRAGLDVEMTPGLNGAAITAAVLAGVFDIGKSSLIALMSAHLHGLPVTILAPAAVYDARTPFTELAVAIDSPAKTAKDLNGKIVAVPSLNDLNQVAISAWLDQNGGDSSSVKFVELPNSAEGVAVAEHRVEAAGLNHPWLADALEGGKIRILADDFNAIGNGFYISVWFTTTDYASKHPDVARAFTRVTLETAQFTNAHHADTAAMIAEITKIPLATVQKMPRVAMGTSVRAAAIQPMIDIAFKYKMIPRGFPARELVFEEIAPK